MDQARWPVWIEQWVLPYTEEPILRPVLFSLLAHVVVVMVPVLLDVVRTGSGWSVFLLLASLVVTAACVGVEIRAIGRPRVVTLLTVATWVGILFFSWLADRTGVW
ncbi:MAG: hypothetical protein H6738_14575 [Alphaproteobacteria bacterium]|nr:hypothetical protein [Alphaproteobacteria bacterium]MCB9698000.1 hypothetical protein [Alphaproteobacteria bacterium]